MAFIKNPKDTERDQQIRQSGSQLPSSTDISAVTPPAQAPTISQQNAANAAGKGGATPESRRSSGTFSGIQKYLKANPNEGDRMAKTVSGNIQTQAQGVQEDALRAGNQFKTAADTAQKTVFNDNDNAAINRYFSSPTYRAPGTQEAKRVNDLTQAQYTGPGDIDTAELKTRSDKTLQRANALGTEEGRTTELQKDFARPDYNSGAKRLDQLLVQTNDNSRGRLAATQKDIADRLPGIADNLSTQAKAQTQQRQSQVEQLRQNLLGRLGIQKNIDTAAVLKPITPNLPPAAESPVPQQTGPQTPPPAPSDFTGIPTAPGDLINGGEFQQGQTEEQRRAQQFAEAQERTKSAYDALLAYDNSHRTPLPQFIDIKDANIQAFIKTLPQEQQDEWIRLNSQSFQNLNGVQNQQTQLKSFLSTSGYGVNNGPERQALMAAYNNAKQQAVPAQTQNNTYVKADVMQQINDNMPQTGLLNDQVEIRDNVGNLLFKGSSSIVNYIKRYGVDPVDYFYQRGQSLGVSPVIEKNPDEAQRQQLLDSYNKRLADQNAEAARNSQWQQQALMEINDAVQHFQDTFGRAPTDDEKNQIYQGLIGSYKKDYETEQTRLAAEHKLKVEQATAQYQDVLTNYTKQSKLVDNTTDYLNKLQAAYDNLIKQPVNFYNQDSFNAMKADLQTKIAQARIDLKSAQDGLAALGQTKDASTQALSALEKQFDFSKITAGQFDNKPIDYTAPTFTQNQLDDYKARALVTLGATPKTAAEADKLLLDKANSIYKNYSSATAAERQMLTEALKYGYVNMGVDGKIVFADRNSQFEPVQDQNYDSLVKGIQTRMADAKKSVDDEYTNAIKAMNSGYNSSLGGYNVSNDVFKAIMGRDKVGNELLPNFGFNIQNYIEKASVADDKALFYQVATQDELNQIQMMADTFGLDNQYKAPSGAKIGSFVPGAVFNVDKFKQDLSNKFNNEQKVTQSLNNFWQNGFSTNRPIIEGMVGNKNVPDSRNNGSGGIVSFIKGIDDNTIKNSTGTGAYWYGNRTDVWINPSQYINYFDNFVGGELNSANSMLQQMGGQQYNVVSEYQRLYGTSNAADAGWKVVAGIMGQKYVDDMQRKYGGPALYKVNLDNYPRELRPYFLARARSAATANQNAYNTIMGRLGSLASKAANTLKTIGSGTRVVNTGSNIPKPIAIDPGIGIIRRVVQPDGTVRMFT